MTSPGVTTCTVCRRVTNNPTTVGNRHYCPEHIATLTADFRPLWRATAVSLGVLVLEILAVTLISWLAGDVIQQSAQLQIGIGIAVTVTPAVLWMFLVYVLAGSRRGSLSPLLPTVFVLGILTAAAATRPFLLEVVEYQQWLARVNATNRFMGSVLIGGFTHAFILYAIVRYTVWRTPAFDRRVAGVLYALAASWGYGLTFNLLELFDRGGMLVLHGGLREIAQLSGYLASGLVIGYFMARNRFEDMPFFFLSTGLVATAGLNGLILYAVTELNKTSLSIEQDGFSPWPGVIVGLLALIATYVAVYGLLRRHNALTAARLALDHDSA